MNLEYLKHLLALFLFGLIASLSLYFLSPADVQGSIGDAALKLWSLAVKVFAFSLGLKAFFKFLKFSEIFEKAEISTAHALKAVACSIVILAWALVIFPY